MNAILPGEPAVDHLDAIRSSVEAEIAAQPTPDPDLEMPRGFHFRNDGLYHRAASSEKDPEPVTVRVSDRFEVLGETQDGSTREFGILIGWTDRAGLTQTMTVGLGQTRAMRNELVTELVSKSLHVEFGAEQLIARFFGKVRHAKRVHVADRAGWHDVGGSSVFVLPGGRAFGAAADRVTLQAGRLASGRAFQAAGSLDDWHREVARYAIGNDRLALFIAAALAGPLLDVATEESGGLHLVGKSRAGKSTAALCAASVWGRGDRGGMLKTWRATGNGIEAAAAEASDTILLLDEMGQAEAQEAGSIVYLLANNTGKARADRRGDARESRTFRVLFLSTGEVTLDAKMGEANKRAPAGLGVRLVNIPADAGAGMGAFQELHGLPSPAALAEHLRDASRTSYGTAAPLFLDRLVSARVVDPEGLRSDIGSRRAAFIANVLPDGADGQVRSVAGRFGLIAAAGEMATAWGVLPWPEGTAASAASAGFQAWLRDRGGAGAGEDNDAIRAVRAFLSAHGESRFTPVDREGVTDGPRTINRAGFRRMVADGAEYLIMTAAWRDEVCKGMDAARAAKALAVAGFLKLDGNRSTHRVRTPEGRVRAYVVPGSILS